MWNIFHVFQCYIELYICEQRSSVESKPPQIAPIARSGSNGGVGGGGVELAMVGANGTNNNGKAPSDSKIHALYTKYKDSREDMVLSEGIESFCLDLELKPEEFKVNPGLQILSATG